MSSPLLALLLAAGGLAALGGAYAGARRRRGARIAATVLGVVGAVALVAGAGLLTAMSVA